MPQLFASHGQTGYEDIQRKQKMADLLKAMSMQQNPQDLQGGGAIAALAPILRALAASKQQRGVDAEKEQLQGQYNQDYQNVLQALKGTPGQPGQPFVDEQAQFMGQESPQGLQATDAVPAVPGGREAMVQAMLQAKNPQMQRMGLETITGSSKNMPSTIQEWNYYSSLPKKDQARYLEMKRNPNVLNLGDTMAVRGPGGGINESYRVNLKPGEQPSVRGAQAAAVESGKETGKNEAALVEMEANLPRLETVVGQLSGLGQKATYTKSGQALDITRREAGMEPREAAIARKEYISKVDNEVLPLLRQTFGAQFTEREGQSLKATLGDPNASPAEKDAVLRSFIDSKRAQVETQKRKLGISSPSIDDLLKKY